MVSAPFVRSLIGIDVEMLPAPGVMSMTDSFVSAPSCRDWTAHAAVRERDGDGVARGLPRDESAGNVATRPRAAIRGRPLLAGHCRPTGSIVGPQFTPLRPFKLT